MQGLQGVFVTNRCGGVWRCVVRGVRSVTGNFPVCVCCGLLTLLILISCDALVRAESVTQQASAQAGSLEQFAAGFWNWRARYQPFSTGGIPRRGDPRGGGDWAAGPIA